MIKKCLAAFAFAFSGIWYCIQKEQNFRIQLLAIPVVVFLGIVYSLRAGEWIFILISIAAVLSLEMINTGIEKICNFIQPAQHPQIKIIKDVSAGAVLIVSIMAFICSLIIFLPKI